MPTHVDNGAAGRRRIQSIQQPSNGSLPGNEVASRVTGQPQRIAATRTRQTNRRFRTSAQARSLFATGA